MKTYIVWHNFPDDLELQGFRCQADDIEHALEQCSNAYPDASLIEAEEIVE